MTIKKIKYRNPVQRYLKENGGFKIKVHNAKKEPPKEPTIQEALIEMEEEKDEKFD